MSIELVYRMRTCAAALADGRVVPMTEAADLLIEASNLLDVPEPLGEPMEMIHPVILADKASCSGPAVWGGELPTATVRPCPNCGIVSARTVKRVSRSLMLTCPECSATWEYGK